MDRGAGPPAVAPPALGPPATDIPDAGTAPLVVRYFAAARAAAGVAEERVPAGRCLDDLAGELADRHGERLGAVLGVASFLVDGVAWHDRRASLPPGATVDVLPPFAGG